MILTGIAIFIGGFLLGAFLYAFRFRMVIKTILMTLEKTPELNRAPSLIILSKVLKEEFNL